MPTTMQNPSPVPGAAERRDGRSRRTPSLFVAHGSPMSVLDRGFASALRRFLPSDARLRAVVIVSAHWQTTGPLRVSSQAAPALIYDFSGFPPWLYEINYPCPGDPSMAQRVATLLVSAGLDVALDTARGLDHGVWVPLSLALPDARVPVIQVSLPAYSDPQALLAMGRALATLRTDDVLVVGSGGIVHNLAHLHMEMADDEAEPWAKEFDDWVRARAGALDVEGLTKYQRGGPHAGASVPTSEHYDPLLVVMGTLLDGDTVEDVYAGFRYGTLSMRSLALVGRRRGDRLA
jgi:4,5-DOPA dioxygenase extradiol